MDGKGWRSYKKGLKNKEGKEEPWKRGKVKPEQMVREMVNEEEKEQKLIYIYIYI